MTYTTQVVLAEVLHSGGSEERVSYSRKQAARWAAVYASIPWVHRTVRDMDMKEGLVLQSSMKVAAQVCLAECSCFASRLSQPKGHRHQGK